jgi:hypothetical protein
MYLGCAPLPTLLTDMVRAPQNELAPFAPERRAEILVIRSNATICRIGHDCLFSGEIAARGNSDAYAPEGGAVQRVVEFSNGAYCAANLFNDLRMFIHRRHLSERSHELTPTYPHWSESPPFPPAAAAALWAG